MAKKNMISASLSQNDMAEIKTAIQTIVSKVPFLINITDDQRKAGLKLGDKTIAFVDKVVDYQKDSPNLILAYVDTAEFSKDYRLTKDLFEIMRTLKPLVQRIEDTATEAGIESLASALSYYNAVRIAAKQGEENAKVIYDDLQKRFPGGSPAKQPVDNTATN
jgi:hypothetical protein